ncbi:UvrD-helicase domain-containing protein [Kutzneria sp. NPDC051319]|uniref:UvrD-helicase domain-containing protein n=1 Tax=Kutzneria sp. NPDC051319 TaxID=3155047 RepID=UPI003418EB3A
MARLAIDKEFLRDFARLEKPVQDRVTEVFGKFEQDSQSGRNLEKIVNARDPRFRSIRITQFWRGVVLAPDSGDTYVLLKVLPHDDAYVWAQRRTASVNAATGRIEIRDVVAIDETIPALSDMAAYESHLLFEQVGDADLRRLGVDDQTLSFARVLTDPVQLDAARSFLPPTQWDVLFGLAAGLSPEEVWAELGAALVEGAVDAEDIDAAVKRSPDRIVLVDGPDELMAILRHPFASWRIYLHPVQRAVVETRYRGPARVTGGPGTGKTVVALHRAHHLAQYGHGKVLVTTFTSTLADSLRAGLKLLVASAEVAACIEVAHVDQVAHRAFREEHGVPTMLSAADEKAMWKQLVERLDLPFSESFLAEEWRQVVLGQRISTEETYLAASRVGRGRRLRAQQRQQVWSALQQFDTSLRDRNLWTHETVTAEAVSLLERGVDKPYRHVVVDEAQDLSPEAWRLLRAVVPDGDDDIFAAGDTHQRIYKNFVNLSEFGIRVAGRSTKLTINYRTTAEILAWSLGLLRGERIDDMNGGLDSIAGCRSELHGQPPELRGFHTREEEFRFVGAKIRQWLESGVQVGEIGVAVRSNWLSERVQEFLTSEQLPAHLLADGQPTDTEISVGTMHRMKGLEFRCLVVVGVGARYMPALNAVTPLGEDAQTHELDRQRERCLLFVACTRAREQLVVTWHESPSPFLSF